MTEPMTRLLRRVRDKFLRRHRKPQWSESQFFTTDTEGNPPTRSTPTKETL